jgi:NADPH:quinone reductase-like Zn-dependent oxidoreductase
VKAIRMHQRGGAEQLLYEEAPVPVLEPGDALVRVHAAGITPTELSWSATYTTRDGVDRLPVVPGHDVSGVIEAITSKVTDVMIGDEVYGLTDFWRDGAGAEFVAVRAADLAASGGRRISSAHRRLGRRQKEDPSFSGSRWRLSLICHLQRHALGAAHWRG